jgi:hypothetical protein
MRQTHETASSSDGSEYEINKCETTRSDSEDEQILYLTLKS